MAHGQHRGAVLPHLRQVALRGGVGPHLAVHGRRQQQRNTLLRARQAQQAQQFIGPPWASRATKSALQGAIKMASASRLQVDVGHIVGSRASHCRAIHRAARQRLHGHRRNELGSRLGHDDLYGGPSRRCTAQLGRFVTGYASTEAQDDVFASKLVHACNLADEALRRHQASSAWGGLYNQNFPPP